jgi:hypothetical protein
VRQHDDGKKVRFPTPTQVFLSPIAVSNLANDVGEEVRSRPRCRH